MYKVFVFVLALPSLVFAQSAPGLPRQADAATVGQAVRRLLVSVDANPKTSTRYKQGDWKESIGVMKKAGVNQYHYAKVWSEIERSAGKYDLDDVKFKVEQAAPLPIAFNLRVLDAGARNMPDAYKPLAWDSQEMIGHVIGVVDAVAPVLGSRPWSYAVGNEVDLYFASHPTEVPAYGRMLQRVKARIRQLHPAASFTVSFQSTAAPQLRSLYAPITSVLDHVAFTYYPLQPDLTVRPPTTVPADLNAMVAAAQPLPVMLQEVGYPTATQLGSSPEAQRVFVQQMFDAVQAFGTSRILAFTYLFQADMPDWLVSDIAKQYGAAGDNFRAFISTLGLRDQNDQPKPAWNEFVTRAQQFSIKRPH